MKITSKLRIVGTHKRHIMKNPAKELLLHQSHGGPDISTYIQNTPTNTHSYMHTHLNTYIHNIFSQTQKLIFFYFEELDVFMPKW